MKRNTPDKYPIEDYLTNLRPISSFKLKNKLINSKLKSLCCERCLAVEWLGSPIPTELHHIDGNHENNHLNNLQILCRNCHALTTNFSGKNKLKTCAPRISDEEILKLVPTFENKRQLLKSIGLNATGKGYQRITVLLAKNPEINFKERNPRKPYVKKGRKSKINWPDPQELQKLLWEKPTTKIAKSLGVSDKAIDYFSKKHQLTKPKRGYWSNSKADPEGIEPSI